LSNPLGSLNNYLAGTIREIMQDFSVFNNEINKQFEIQSAGETALLQYRFSEDQIWLMHTWVPEKLEGKGIASALAKYGLEWARDHDKKVKVLCPFVAIFLKRHPQYNSLVIP
jgi:uncharacterized protein